MPSAQYRPLDTGNGRPVQSSVLRGAHGGKIRALCPKTANSRRVFVCVMLLIMLLVYVVWCAVANYTDDGRADAYTTTGKFIVPHSTSPRSQGWNFLAVAVPLMFNKLNGANNANNNDSLLYFNSSIIGLNLSTLSPKPTANNDSARDMQRLPSE